MVFLKVLPWALCCFQCICFFLGKQLVILKVFSPCYAQYSFSLNLTMTVLLDCLNATRNWRADTFQQLKTDPTELHNSAQAGVDLKVMESLGSLSSKPIQVSLWARISWPACNLSGMPLFLLAVKHYSPQAITEMTTVLFFFSSCLDH